MPEHLPVLLKEAVSLLAPERGGTFLDATLGLGGHSRAILERAVGTEVRIRLLGMDQDLEAIRQAKQNLGDQVEYFHGNFADLKEVVAQAGLSSLDGILVDLGVSSLQLDEAERGFSFQREGPLDMRMDPRLPLNAFEIVNSWPQEKLEELIWKYGEEPRSRRIARAIIQMRQKRALKTTTELAELILHQYPLALRYKSPHPATRTFQALRLAVNQELEVLTEALPAAWQVLNPGGRLVVISFHSLEDRLVKQSFKDWASEGKVLTKKPITPSLEEQRANPRSRSAKLRAIEKKSNF